MAKKKKKTVAEDDLSAEDLGVVPEEKKKKTTAKKKTSKKKTTTKKKTTKKSSKKSDFIQSSCNVGLVGHVDHGKTTLVKALSGTWTEKYADEINRGITIKLGYAEAAVMQCPKCNRVIAEALANLLRKSKKDPKGHCPDCGEKLAFKRRISFVDAPGHEILMATMLSGASLMDGAVLLVAANEDCPQPQTREHLAALEIAKIENIIIVQNKVDSVGKERAIEHYNQIKSFVKGTIAENAPIIPTSAIFQANVDKISELIEEIIPSPDFEDLNEEDFLFNVARSFDINRPGISIDDLAGGVMGGSIISGQISVGDQVEIRPGLKNPDSGKYKPVITTVKSIYEGKHSLETARPGGLIAIGTELDPSNTRTDQLIGNVVGTPETLPEVKNTVEIETHLLEKVLGAEEDISVKPIAKNELIMIVVGTSLSAGVVSKIGKHNSVSLQLKRPICALGGSIVALSRRIHNRFRLIGYGYLAE
ncbi:Translation initiation factor 2 subunit gamma [Candidatus Lokiarchaeum ossiferum]|uniref:protein-synthesizing GTPase n=1 Tax=Candidatus Lokiarchaeum ossiferum TaxID=2951803 RepID=A0ABY6HYL8_9ARCH|nr:Translation initiation factor 2 subunit gamma [Candidatus Lokiarchaeum sp. B-35]